MCLPTRSGKIATVFTPGTLNIVKDSLLEVVVLILHLHVTFSSSVRSAED